MWCLEETDAEFVLGNRQMKVINTANVSKFKSFISFICVAHLTDTIKLR